MKTFLDEYKIHLIIVIVVLTLWAAITFTVQTMANDRLRESDPVGYHACELYEESLNAPSIMAPSIRKESAAEAYKAATPEIRALPDPPETDRLGEILYRTSSTEDVFFACKDAGFKFDKEYF